MRRLAAVIFTGLVVCACGCKTVAPSNDRDWSPDQAVLPTADLGGDRVTVHNIRRCCYLGPTDYAVGYVDRSYDLTNLRSVDYIVVPFRDSPTLAHTMLSFGFVDPNQATNAGHVAAADHVTMAATGDLEPTDFLAVSVEIRKEKGETFDVLRGLARQYEVMYVVADERDVIDLRANHRGDDVYVYRVRATPQRVRQLFVDVLRRVNHLADEPEFYNSLTNNCTTNIVRHINALEHNRVPYDYRILLPGRSDELAYDLGLLVSAGSFAETRRLANISPFAAQFRDDPDFSFRIRQAALQGDSTPRSHPDEKKTEMARSEARMTKPE